METKQLQTKLGLLCRNYTQAVLPVLTSGATLNVTDIAKLAKLDRDTTSQGLTHLRTLGFVKAQRKGKEVYYTLCSGEYEKFKQLAESMQRVLK